MFFKYSAKIDVIYMDNNDPELEKYMKDFWDDPDRKTRLLRAQAQAMEETDKKVKIIFAVLFGLFIICLGLKMYFG